MKVIFETMGGTRFPVDVGESGTLQEMKEKVERALEIPIADQILYFNGNILYRDVDLLGLRQGSVIKFRVAGDPTPEPQPETMNLQLQLPTSQIITLETCGGDTVQELKEKIKRKVGGTPADRILIMTDDGMEIPDFRRLREYSISFYSGVTVVCLRDRVQSWRGSLSTVRLYNLPLPSFSPLSPRKSRPSNSSPGKSRLSVMSSEKMRLVVLFRGLRMVVEVGRSDMVRELRRRLVEEKFKVGRDREFCFYHKQALLDEDRSFASQNVANGDIIYIEFTTGRARI